MKITAIELSEIEISEIVSYLTSKFNTEDNKQTIEEDLSEIKDFENVDNFQFESVLELYTEASDFDDNHQSKVIYRSVVKLSITFFYDGEEIKVNSKNLDAIYKAIHKYYEI